MNNIIKLIITLAVSLLISATTSTAFGKEQYPAAHVASPDVYKEIMTNQYVRVLAMTLQPGQSDRWHHHPDETVYFTSGGTLKIHLPNGKSVTKKVNEGDIMPHEAWVHRVENGGETVVTAVIIEDMT